MTRRSKYNAKPTLVDGIRFHSRKEAEWYIALRETQKCGAISGLKLQPKFDCIVNGIKIMTYRADFAFLDHRTDKIVVQDVKGYRTPVYKLKRRLVEALYPNVKIVEI